MLHISCRRGVNLEINSRNFIEIFKRNFSYPVVETVLGTCIKMDPYNAFIFSNVTGSGYFDDPVYPFTPKGLLKVFYSAFDYNFVTGIFDHSTLKNTPYQMYHSKKYLFENEKYILPVEFEKEHDLQKFLMDCEEKLIGSGIKTTDFIIQRIEKRKKGNGMEPFLEYIAAESFKKNGYIVESQIPLTYNTGSPDFGGYKLDIFNDIPKEFNYFKGGFHLIELSLIRFFERDSTLSYYSTIEENSAIVGEAKTATRQMTEQLKKYMNTKLYGNGYEIHPSKSSPGNKGFGLLTFTDNFEIKLKNAENIYITENCDFEYRKSTYFNWLENYVKYYLIANFSNDDLNKIYEIKMKTPVSSQEDIIDFINTLNINQIFDLILKIIK